MTENSVLTRSLLCAILNNIGMWDSSNLKDTIYWSLSIGLLLLMKSFSGSGSHKAFDIVIKDYLKIVVILEFILNLYVFNFWIEFISVPVITIIVISQLLAERDAGLTFIKKITNQIIAIYVIIILGFSIYEIWINFREFATYQNLKSFLLPPLLTILILPYAYAMALLASYEMIFLRLKILNKDDKLVRYAKIKILLNFNIDLKRLDSWSQGVGLLKVDSKSEVLHLIQKMDTDSE